MQLTIDAYYTLIAATIVLFIGHYLNKHISVLSRFNIPEPVSGGLVVALMIAVVHYFNSFTLNIDSNLQNGLMLMFFSSIGLNADFSRLRAGGKPLVLLTIVVSVFILVQNTIGIGLSTLLGLNPLTGLLAGSITLTGGHGTAGGWAPVLSDLGVEGAMTLGMACATFGLVLGGLTGGPVAESLLRKSKRTLKTTENETNDSPHPEIPFEQPHLTRAITADSALETIAMFAIALASANYLSRLLIDVLAETTIRIPTFVLALASGIIIRNILARLLKIDVFDRCVDIIGNVSLSLFLAMALLSLKLWQLVDLAIPLLIILFVQTVAMVLYARYVTFRVLGGDYDAAVIAAGHCGFGMGATPTAVANMQAVTHRYGVSHKAFLIVPLVGAFFVDIINTFILSIITSLPLFH